MVNKIFLIGFMGSGKTTIGKKLANKLNYEFIDMDDFIVSKYNKSINTIFAEEGESKFREYERETIKHLNSKENIVISTGGGAPCFFDNIEVMNQNGLTVYLKLRPGFLANRLTHAKDQRPLIKGKSEGELIQFITESLEKREVFYTKAQKVIINEDTSISEVIKTIISSI